jgi:hypothetical protein
MVKTTNEDAVGLKSRCFVLSERCRDNCSEDSLFVQKQYVKEKASVENDRGIKVSRRGVCSREGCELSRSEVCGE